MIAADINILKAPPQPMVFVLEGNHSTFTFKVSVVQNFQGCLLYPFFNINLFNTMY
jgi:hypothetical protein